MKRQRLILFLSAVVSVALWTYACGDGTTEPPAPDPLQPTAVTVSPATATVVEADTLRLTATATNAYGQVVSGVEFVWASGNTAVAVVDMSGLVTGAGAGEVQVTATAAGLTGRAELTIAAPVPTTIAVTPDSVVLIALGQTTQLTAEVRDQAGRAMEGIPVAWSSADTTVAVVDSSGLVGAVSNGAATVTATAGEAVGEARVTVMQSADRTALVALYNATDGPNWVDNTNWLTDAPLGEWYGVDTDGAGRVVRIDLAGRYDYEAREYVLHGLRGELPAELANLTNLTSLYLSNNDLRGPIPPELGDLSNLENLSLQVNGLSGAIPPELGDLSSLRYLYLGDNDLSGPIPPELGDLSNLARLYLGRNGLYGSIPPELGDLSNLRYLNLSSNALAGAIPPELGDLSNLENLSLQVNGLSGAIPPELGDLSNLWDLNFSDNGLSGPIPPELGGLSNLVQLNLSFNALSGAIPPELGGLSNLENLSLQVNGLSGAIPPELGDLSSLRYLNLSSNALAGAIPPELGDLSNLEDLALGDNDLSGAIPRSFLQLDQLEWFFIGGQDVCVPGTSSFVVWMRRIAIRENAGIFCNAADVAALESLYDLTDGANWTKSDGWLGDHPVEDWYGVTADALGHVTGLALEGNGLAGRLPATLGNMPRMTVLRISDNALEDRLPLSLTALDLDKFHYDDTDLCEPADADFQRWLEGIASHRGTAVQCAPLTDRDALIALYASTGGPGWTNSDDWLSEAPLQRWHGVTTDAQGRVVGLSLRNNGLSGEIPPELGGLSSLRYLSLGWNDLSGAIPPELGSLSNLQGLSLYYNALSGAIPPDLGDLTNLETLYLEGNDLSGEIPPELGDLANLGILHLALNTLSGAIPPELGDLSNLEWLSLALNDLSGKIPPELGDLSNLGGLYLHENALSGEIPPELGSLSNLQFLFLSGNDLSGGIPPDLGDLANLRRLSLAANDLAGAVPPTFGELVSLTELELSRNAGLAGAMPAGLRNLALESLQAGGTELCVPREPAFVEWLATITRRWIAVCGEPPAAYLVQAVQSRGYPVPLVAGEEALLRVFVTAAMETTEGMPEVRARFYLNGTEGHVAEIPGSSTPIPTEINEGDLARSANAEIPSRIVRPGLEMVVEIDPDGVLDPSLGVARRIPQEGRLAVDVREMPALDLTVIPFLWSSDPDSAIIGLVAGMSADPEGHALLEDTHVLLPVGGIDVAARAPVASTSNNAFDLLVQTYAIRVLEGGGGHYMGMMSGSVTGAGGVAQLSGRSSFSRPGSGVIAHELGHNMSLWHAPCGAPSLLDPSFPYPDGTIGAWGYDFRRDRLVPATRRDHMSYCGPTWTSDYHFTNALRHRLADEAASSAAHAASPVRTLLLWGGVDTTATPFLNPAFVADAPPTLPDSAGDYTVTGRDASGRELFSLNFTMPVALSEEAEASSFVFALPAQPGWADALASVTLSGPAGTTTLDGDSDIPMAILRDPATGRVRGFLRDVGDPAAEEMGALGSAVGLDLLFSRGIPDAAAWRR